MKDARVALFAHNNSERNLLRGAINNPAGGHQVVSEGPSLGAALHVISLMRSGHREVDVVVVAANVAGGEETGTDARILVDRLRELEVVPKIIGHASAPFDTYGIPVDADILHGELDTDPGRMNYLLASLDPPLRG
ncbi:MAG TPA: hypothetical protein VHB72_04905 [Candidatus Saccharimonadales bacterium]|jgi:hypothetical protein|nr:hypothetical protein [Candidatus Saccharimonadales bacterium]